MDEVGSVNGLAWTPYGGEVLHVEAQTMAGKGTLTLTGQLGDVMKESARAALSWFRAHAATYGADPDFFKTSEIHLHVPSGAIPKDGPSAGVTMVTALASELTRRPVRGDICMTGEITSRSCGSANLWTAWMSGNDWNPYSDMKRGVILLYSLTGAELPHTSQ